MKALPDKLRAVIFDLDGTLVDTADEFVPVVQALRAEHGREPMDPDRIRASVSNGARALVALGLGIEEEHETFEPNRLRLLELYQDVLGSLAQPYDGIPELLDELVSRGITWGMSHFTNASGDWKRNHAILARFDCDLSRDVNDPAMKRNHVYHPVDVYFNHGLNQAQRERALEATRALREE